MTTALQAAQHDQSTFDYDDFFCTCGTETQVPSWHESRPRCSVCSEEMLTEAELDPPSTLPTLPRVGVVVSGTEHPVSPTQGSDLVGLPSFKDAA